MDPVHQLIALAAGISRTPRSVKAGDELGVVLATSAAGVRLEPTSWNEMRCPLTGVKEPRKTARIRREFLEMK